MQRKMAGGLLQTGLETASLVQNVGGPCYRRPPGRRIHRPVHWPGWDTV